ncbi:secretion protein HlyD [Acidihalobacter aeolianus]|uniref:Secretion protein HlyD n=1 Tax=Acidihalobacter aeolianus TaxID=2792603 RepID=A0A1D8K489_9GAMM|nr:HlyD family efflux transporter periplasmic adaptor subunit [Acidihalobacter aeolianus]AOV15772.1 secretion protein HlyD [Acidihalobacter aeolianus]
MPTDAPNKLFRTEALVRHERSWLGRVRVQSPVSHSVYAALALALTLAVAALLIFGRYTRHLSVSGMLVPSQGLLDVSVPLSGTVEKVMVRSGETVPYGAPLMEVAVHLDSPAVGQIGTVIAQALGEEKNLLLDNLQTQRSVFDIQRRMLTGKLKDLQVQRAQVDAEIGVQREDVATTEKILKEFLSVKQRGLVSDPELEQQQLTVYSAKNRLQELRGQHTALTQQIDAARHQLAELPLNARNQENAIRDKLETLRQSLAKTAEGRSLLLRASSAGVVSALTVNPGQAVSAGASVLSITPGHDPLEAQLLVPSRAVGFLHTGSTVLLHYAAFPYREFGAFRGTVRSISPSALTPAEITTLTAGGRSNVPLYRVMVSLHDTAVTVGGRPAPLRAGMQLQAEVTLNRLRLIQWVFEPLYGLGHGFLSGKPASAPAAKPANAAHEGAS